MKIVVGSGVGAGVLSSGEVGLVGTDLEIGLEDVATEGFEFSLFVLGVREVVEGSTGVFGRETSACLPETAGFSSISAFSLLVLLLAVLSTT